MASRSFQKQPACALDMNLRRLLVVLVAQTRTSFKDAQTSAALGTYTPCLLLSFIKQARFHLEYLPILSRRLVLVVEKGPNFFQKAVEMQHLGGMLLLFRVVLGITAANGAARRLQQTFPACGEP